MAARRVLGVRGFPLLLAGRDGQRDRELGRGHRDLGVRRVPLRRRPRRPRAALRGAVDPGGAARAAARRADRPARPEAHARRSPTCSGMVERARAHPGDSYLAIILLALPLGLDRGAGGGVARLDPAPADGRRAARHRQRVPRRRAGPRGHPRARWSPPRSNSRWGLTGAFLVDAGDVPRGRAGGRCACTCRTADGDAEARESSWREVRAGFALVRRTDGLRWTLGVVGSVYLLWALFGLLEPLYVRDVLGESDTVFALLQTVVRRGPGRRGARASPRSATGSRGRATSPSRSSCPGATAALYVGTQSLAVAFVGVFLWGVDVAFFYVPAKTLLQRFAPDGVPRARAVAEPVARAARRDDHHAARRAGARRGRRAGARGGRRCDRRARRARRAAARAGGSPCPRPGPVDPPAGTPRDAIALGGSAPG